MTTPTQADRDAAAAFISPSDGDFEELTELFARNREQADKAGYERGFRDGIRLWSEMGDEQEGETSEN